MILAADVGGTKTLLQVGVLKDRRWQPRSARRYDDDGYPDFAALLAAFLDEFAARGQDSACLLRRRRSQER